VHRGLTSHTSDHHAQSREDYRISLLLVCEKILKRLHQARAYDDHTVGIT